MSVTQSILALVLEKAGDAGAERVSRINLVIGELSGIVDDCVRFYWDFLSKDTIAAGAELSFSQQPAQMRCRHCATVFSPENGAWACPECQSPGLEILSGVELLVESIEVN